ncbi:MAG TPA: CocE/NonD family hydrolase [Mycobacteriales bacterium]|nr:CocE/NonD family hydrolase [Mycobacteriales bacterium]
MPDEPRVLWNVRIPMRDGIALANNVYLPPTGLAGGPYPVIFSRNPYNRQVWADALRWRFFTEQGYAFVTQDCRGRFDSDGVFYPFFDDGPDAYDSIEWIAEQPWCTGKIGMMSGSYGGWVQWAAAREKPPHLTTLVSSCAAGKWGEELPWDRGGASFVMFTWLYMMVGHSMQPTAHVDWARVFRHLPLRTLDKAMGKEVPAWQDWLDHPGLDKYWLEGRLDDDFAELDIPALHLTGWYDGDQPGEMFFWDGMLRSKAAKWQHLLVGPWTHGGVFKPTQSHRDNDFTPKSVADMNEVHLRWFDYWLKGIDNGLIDEPPVRYFYTGINEWRTDSTWPPTERTETSLYLRSGGAANTALGDGALSGTAPTTAEPADVYRYDPEAVANVMEIDFFNGEGNNSVRPADARPLEMRDDLLVYTSEPVTEALYVSGRPSVVLHASSDCPDTDFVVGLADVEPDGRSVPLSRDEDHQWLATQGGRIRARFREGLDKEVFMTPGEIYEFRIQLRDVAHVFKPGHRIRLTVMSWDFPAMARNLNTDESIADGTTIRVATNSVHHTEAAPSRVILPVESVS